MKGQKRIWKKVTDTEEWRRRSKIRTTEDPKEENKIREQLTVKLYSRNSFWKKYLKWHTGKHSRSTEWQTLVKLLDIYELKKYYSNEPFLKNLQVNELQTKQNDWGDISVRLGGEHYSFLHK